MASPNLQAGADFDATVISVHAMLEQLEARLYVT